MKWKVKVATLVIGAVLIAGAGGVFAGMSINDDTSDTRYASDGSEHSGADTNEDTLQDGFDKMEQVYQTITEQYVEDVDESELIEGALKGMVEELDDPHSAYMDQETASEFSQSLESSFEGIGAEVSMVDDAVTIVAPFKDSPAEKAGLQPSDQILQVDGESTEGDSLNETVLKIRGEKGSTVTLTVQREGTSEPFDVEVERDEIPVETVYSETFEENGQTIGYLELTSFSENTAAEFEEHLTELEESGIDGLIVDVRGNPGGFLNSVEEIGNLIIPGNETVVQIEDPNGERVQSVSTLSNKKDYPIVGLINEGSVSASEILAAALKEAGGYDLVGQTTFGKGTVQQSMQLGDGSELKLSMFKWLTSDGNWINEEGVEPTVEVTQPDYFYSPALSIEDSLQQDNNAEQVKTAQEMLKGLGHDPGRTDGYFDEQTVSAVESFQAEQEGLDITGVIDEETAGRLNQALLELIRDPANDRQLHEALDLVSEQASS
ncbi:carboxyl-terminal processing protease [Alteribacillus persepolensis]|uniref:C-terminal processing peptidase n=1 Tax=Alteribacillus persepolensis TaxID=568899 RepID=A0A1G8AI01_9BACI|nr:S41 family peptidase [Alteribacillus persepolensis]SDH20476.1 carboxyl-terminal processing protease [Alteribacillus persepolensis]